MTEKNHDITVATRVTFIPDQSATEDERYVFAYTITITNTGSVPVQLVSRHWIITDANNQVQDCLLYTSPSPRDGLLSRMPSSA